MLVACWSVKGGSGTTVVAAGLAITAGRRAGGCHSLLVDLAGDLPPALGLEPGGGEGVAEWLASVVATPANGLAGRMGGGTGPIARASDLRVIERPVDNRLSILPRGAAPFGSATSFNGADEVFAARLAADGRFVVVDAGTLAPNRRSSVADTVIEAADASLLVIRSCYLGLRRVATSKRRVDGVVLVDEPGRSLSIADVTSVAGAPVVARLRVEPQFARVVDAGLLCSRLPSDAESALTPLTRVG